MCHYSINVHTRRRFCENIITKLHQKKFLLVRRRILLRYTVKGDDLRAKGEKKEKKNQVIWLEEDGEGDSEETRRHTFLGASRFGWWSRTVRKLSEWARALMEVKQENAVWKWNRTTSRQKTRMKPDIKQEKQQQQQQVAWWCWPNRAASGAESAREATGSWKVLTHCCWRAFWEIGPYQLQI